MLQRLHLLLQLGLQQFDIMHRGVALGLQTRVVAYDPLVFRAQIRERSVIRRGGRGRLVRLRAQGADLLVERQQLDRGALHLGIQPGIVALQAGDGIVLSQARRRQLAGLCGGNGRTAGLLLGILELGGEHLGLALRRFLVRRERLHLRGQPAGLFAQLLDQFSRRAAAGGFLFPPGFLQFQPLVRVGQLGIGLAGFLQGLRQFIHPGGRGGIDRPRRERGNDGTGPAGPAFLQQASRGGQLAGGERLGHRITRRRRGAVFHREAEPRVSLPGIPGQAAAPLVEHEAEIVLRGPEALFGGGPVKPGGLGLVLGHPAPVLKEQSQVVLRAGQPAVGRLLVPARRLRLVLLHAPADLVGEAEGEVGFNDAVFRRLLVPEVGLEKILPHPAAGGIHVADVELRRGETLPGGHEIILEGQRLVRLHATPELVDQAQVELRGGKAAVAGPPVPFQRLRVVPRQAELGVGVGVAQGILRITIGLLGPAAEDRQLGGRRRLRPPVDPGPARQHHGAHQHPALLSGEGDSSQSGEITHALR